LSADILFEVAHVNYGLRGASSDADEQFVKTYCQNYFIPFHSHRIIDPPQSNIQEWARGIRYQYFEELLTEFQLDVVLTAHHFDDQLETFILNFTRGSGMSGLTGIRHRRDHIRRPLLFARKKQIEAYALAHHLAWREDASNDGDYYLRNRVRHDITPVLDDLRQHDQGMRHSLSHLKELDSWLNRHFKTLMDSYKQSNGEWQLNIKQFFDENRTFELNQILRTVGFHADQINNMLTSQRTGTKYYSGSHVAIIDRGMLRFREKINREFEEITFDAFTEDFELVIGPVHLSIKKMTGNAVERSHVRSYFDVQHIHWPLKIRKWRAGDRFQPFGMYGKTKKVSDLLVHLKLSFFEKEETLVLVDAHDEILWVIGYRRAMAAPVTDQTQMCLVMEKVEM
jgi:tRNA(Ile)-lysidine synthase